MEGLNNFKAEFKNQAINFASVYHVIKSGDGNREEKIEDAYTKFEKFVLDRFNTWILDMPSKTVPEEPDLTPKVDPEDTTLSLDF